MMSRCESSGDPNRGGLRTPTQDGKTFEYFEEISSVIRSDPLEYAHIIEKCFAIST